MHPPGCPSRPSSPIRGVPPITGHRPNSSEASKRAWRSWGRNSLSFFLLEVPDRSTLRPTSLIAAPSIATELPLFNKTPSYFRFSFKFSSLEVENVAIHGKPPNSNGWLKPSYRDDSDGRAKKGAGSELGPPGDLELADAGVEQIREQVAHSPRQGYQLLPESIGAGRGGGLLALGGQDDPPNVIIAVVRESGEAKGDPRPGSQEHGAGC